MVEWTKKMNDIVEYIDSNSTLLNNCKVVRSGDIEDVAMDLPCIEVSAIASFDNFPNSVNGYKVPIAKIDFFVNVTASSTPSASVDMAFELAFKLFEILRKPLNRPFSNIIFDSIVPVIKVDEHGQIANAEYATVVLNCQVAL